MFSYISLSFGCISRARVDFNCVHVRVGIGPSLEKKPGIL